MVRREPWEDRLEAELACRIHRKQPVSGGDINLAWSVQLTDERWVFVKANEHSPARMFEAEAEGLSFLREHLEKEAPLVVPEVLVVGETFLALELLRATSQDQSEAFGRGLAGLHRRRLPTYGGDGHNFIGTLSQSNSPTENWPEFFRTERIEAQLNLPGATRLLTRATRQRFETLLSDLEQRLSPQEPPSPLHGDLWGGNYLSTSIGPAIFDPAAYAGHREVDLAMMKLFGGFSERTFAAYQEAYPLAPGHEQRIKIYQLYPLLVHVNLFGGGYAAEVESRLRELT